MIAYYYPGVSVKTLTLDQFWDKLKHLKTLLGIKEEKAVSEDGTSTMSPDEWFQKAAKGEIEIEGIGGEMPTKVLTEKELQEQKIKAELSWMFK